MESHNEEVNNTIDNFLLDSEITVCNICGEGHLTESCSLMSELIPVKDTPTISHARLTLPSGLKVVSLAGGGRDCSPTVVASDRFNRGTHFGPFQAQLTTDLHPGVSFPLKITGKTGNDGYYLDTTDEEMCNWMCLVAPASTASEQNLICYDMKQNIYFTSIKDILPGEELRVWYAFYYGLKLQVLPLADESDSEDCSMDLPKKDLSNSKVKTNVGQELGSELLESLAQHLPAHTLGARMEKDRWQCRFCEKHECNVALYAKHLMTHYRPKCHLCDRRFYSDKALLKHQKNRHPNLEGINSAHHQSNDNAETSILKSGSPPEAGRVTEIDGNIETPTISTERWNDLTDVNESNVEENQDSMKLTNDNIILGNQGNFCSLITVDKECQEVITVNNLNTSEIVQTQLVLADDGSVVYHVANIPDGILATEMDKLGLLVVESENSPHTGGAAQSVWNAQTDDFAAPSESDGRENNELLHHGTSEVETFRVDNKVEQRNGNSVALILLNTIEKENQLENPENQLEHPGYQLEHPGNQMEHLGNQLDYPGNQLEHPGNQLEHPGNQLEHPGNQVEHSGNQVEHPGNQLEELKNQQADFHQHKISDEQCETLDKDTQKIDDSTRKPETESSFETKDIPSSSLTCDICSKTFGKSVYLYRHLRKHTGEFTCINCLVVFARKENLRSHSCTRPMVRHPCHICGKKFSAKKYLQRHIPLHTGEFTCDKCRRHFVSKLSLACHRCRTDEAGSSNNVKCLLCERFFTDQIKLQAHLSHHSKTNPDGNRTVLGSPLMTRKLRKRKANNISEVSLTRECLSASEYKSTAKDNSKGFICEVCGSIFKSFSSMKTHRFLHGERRFECEICGKRFHRKDVLQEHVSVHQSPQLPCAQCGKKFKTKKSLEVHMMLHVGSKRFTCNDCGKEFYQKGNLIKHQRVHTPPEERTFACQYCSKSFTSREYLSTHTLEHTQGKIFQCPNCSKSFVKKHLLETHQQTSHSNRAFLCRYCNSLMRHRHSARRHLEQQHPERVTEWSQSGFVDQMLAQLPPDSLLLNNGTAFPGQQEIRQEQLLSLRRQHFGANLLQSNGSTFSYSYEILFLSHSKGRRVAPSSEHSLFAKQADKGKICATKDCQLIEGTRISTDANAKENSDLPNEGIATLTLQQQVDFLADPVMSNSHLTLDEMNIIPNSFDGKKPGEEVPVLVEVVEPQLEQNELVHQSGGETAGPTTDTMASRGNSAQVTIGGNTYILQDQLIFEDDGMASGDILLYVLDSEAQQ